MVLLLFTVALVFVPVEFVLVAFVEEEVLLFVLTVELVLVVVVPEEEEVLVFVPLDVDEEGSCVFLGRR